MLGWVKLHRKLMQSCIFHNEKLLKVFIWCLLKASHTDYECVVGMQKVTLSKGQFVYGRNIASLELNIKKSTLTDYMTFLKKNNNITIQSNNKFSVVTVVNWELYQEEDNFSDIKTDNKPTSKRQQSDTNKNVKNDKKYICSNEFEEFYSLYPRKQKKKEALIAFNKLKPDKELLNTIIKALERAKRSTDWQKDSGRYIPLPASWLNGERWTDEIYEEKNELRGGF